MVKAVENKGFTLAKCKVYLENNSEQICFALCSLILEKQPLFTSRHADDFCFICRGFKIFASEIFDSTPKNTAVITLDNKKTTL